MKYSAILLLSYLFSCSANDNPENPQSIYDFTVKDTDGNDVSLEKYNGKVLLIVNIASHCGLTKVNYKELTELTEKYEGQDFKILSFPSDQFGQMPENDGDDMRRHLEKSHVKLGDIFMKIILNGPNESPLYTYLKKQQGGFLGGSIKWNFAKFLIDKNGKPILRFGPTTAPKNIISSIEDLLNYENSSDY